MNKIKKNKIGSSETIREAFNFNFSKYIENKPEHIKKIDIVFLVWFIGFVEGNGNFIIYSKKNNKNKYFSFYINQKDPQLLFKIKKKLGFGIVINYKKKNQVYYQYSVSDIDNIIRLIYIFNGNLILEKVQNIFKEWLHIYNQKYPEKKIIYKNFCPILNLNSSWLSGFIDAKGGFYASLTKQKNFKLGYRLRLKFYIARKDIYFLLKGIIKIIYFKQQNSKSPTKINLFNPDRYISKYSSNIDKLEITTNSFILVIINYLNEYSLQSKKKITFLRWKRIYLNQDSLKNLSIKSKKSLKRFKRLVSSMK